MPIVAASPRCWSSEQVNRSRLKSYNSYGDPEFVTRGYYEDKPFRCVDCKSEQIWTAKQQKWWYETAQGAVYTTAIRCRACRQNRRAAPHLKKEAKCKTTIK
nr:zinc-ribbon domain-containing protein [Chitinivorax sp. B]